MRKKLFNLIVLSILLLPTNVFAQVNIYDVHAVGENYKVSYLSTPPVLESVIPYTGGYSYCRWEYSNLPLSGFTTAPGAYSLLNYTYNTPLQNTTYFRRVLNINGVDYTSNTVKIEVVSINNENMNYIREHNVLVPAQSQWTVIDQLPIGDKFETTTYLDNLGRPIQKVAKGLATPNLPATEPWGDIVQFSTYDELSRKNKYYLPYTTNANPGKFKPNPVADQAQYYTNNYNESSPYSRIEYDFSPLNRAKKVNASGTSWASSLGSSADFQVPLFFETFPIFRIGYAETDVPVPSGNYATNQLIKIIQTDENGKKVIEYYNKNGQILLKKVQLSDSPTLFYEGWICTFFIYDDFGQLRYQLQPEAVKWLTENQWDFSSPAALQMLDNYCFVYAYDIFGNNTYKKTPGAKPLYMIYTGPGGNLLLTQDGNQRAKAIPEWTYYQYDLLFRPTKTSIYPTTRTRQDILENPYVPYEDFSSLVLLKETYYDTYNYTNVKPFDTNFDNEQAGSVGAEVTATTKRTLNMPTGSKVRILATNNFLMNTVYYDERGRAIQTLEDNIKQGTDVTTLQYDFNSRLLNKAEKHTAVGTAYSGYSIITKYAFDKLGRVTDIYKKFGTNAFKHIGNYAFDDFGRIKKKRLDPEYTGTGKNEIETLNYSYNIHGNLTGINKNYALKEAGLNKWDYFFGMYLGYDNRDGNFNAQQLDGHITGVIWNTQGDDEQRRYDYTYDNVGRLSKAAFTQKAGTVWSNTQLDFSVTGSAGKIEYDLNGNLQSLLQKGMVVGTQTPLNVDELKYSYATNSNKLTSVTDQSNAGIANGKLGDFVDGSNASDDYVYDDNGNLVIDLNKNVKDLNNVPGANGITYNYLDKPDQIRLVGKGLIKIVYDADGNKLQKIYTPENTSLPAVTTSYINGFIYKENALQFIAFEEGRLRIMEQTSLSNNFDYVRISGTEDMPENKKGTFDFFVRDYLSNVRMVLTEERHVGCNICTMEVERAPNEEPIFGKTDANGVPLADNEVAARFPVNDIPGQTTGNGWQNNDIGSHVAKLYKGRRGANGRDMGPGSLLKVMAGDNISATTIYYYQNPVFNNTNNTSAINSILSSLTAAISSSGATSSVAHGAASNITNNLSSNVQFTNITSPDAGNPSGTNPKAYLSVLFFDERFNFVAEGSTTARVQGEGNGQAPLVISDVKAPKNGYAYVYLSNENIEPVYFDNFRVVHTRGHIIEENHYYAYGLKIAGLSSTKAGDVNEGELKNKRQYQAAFSEYDDDIQWNDFALRNYDPQIARWVQQDPYQQFASPYVALGGDPINFVDPSGGWSVGAGLSKALGISKIGTAGVTTFIGIWAGAAATAGSDNGKGMIIGAFLGLASYFVGGASASIGKASVQALNGAANEVSDNHFKNNMPSLKHGQKRGGPSNNPSILNDDDERTDKLKNIMIIIPLNVDLEKYLKFDGDDYDEWHYIVSNDITDANEKLHDYLGKDNADNIVVDNHGGILKETNEAVIKVTSSGSFLEKKYFLKYPQVNEPVKRYVKAFVEIGKKVKSGGNYFITACYAGLDNLGDKLGRKLGEFLNCNIYLTAGLCYYPAVIFKGRPIIFPENINNIKKFNKNGIDKGKININKNKIPFQFSN